MNKSAQTGAPFWIFWNRFNFTCFLANDMRSARLESNIRFPGLQLHVSTKPDPRSHLPQSAEFSRRQGQFVVQNRKLRLAIGKWWPISVSVEWRPTDFKVHPAWVYLSCLKPAPLSNSWPCWRVPPEQSCTHFKNCHCPLSLQQHLNPH